MSTSYDFGDGKQELSELIHVEMKPEDHLNISTAIIDKDGAILSIDDRFREIFGLSEYANEKPFIQYLPPYLQLKFQSALQQSVDVGQSQEIIEYNATSHQLLKLFTHTTHPLIIAFTFKFNYF